MYYENPRVYYWISRAFDVGVEVRECDTPGPASFNCHLLNVYTEPCGWFGEVSILLCEE